MKKLLMLVLFFVSFGVFAAPVDVNTADAATIAAALHGIGLKKAQAIVADREKNGAFKTLEDLGRVKGIGDKTLAKNKADIQFGASAAAPIAAAPAQAPVAATSAPAAAPEVAPAALTKIKAAATSAAASAAPVSVAPAIAVPTASSPIAAPSLPR